VLDTKDALNALNHVNHSYSYLQLFINQTCGNGYLEAGEECDCGTEQVFKNSFYTRHIISKTSLKVCKNSRDFCNNFFWYISKTTGRVSFLVDEILIKCVT